MKMKPTRFVHLFLFLCLMLGLASPAKPARAAANIYYVSSSGGSDSNPGNSAAQPLATISKVNSLSLQPGDHVLFKCGDVWQADPLVLSRSGTAGAPVTFGSYPAGCTNQPSLSGSRAIAGWEPHSGSIYRAELSEQVFPYGINQLFRGGERLTLGRWPNLNAASGGYAFVDAHSAGSAQITDAELPPADWSGAVLHIKNIRWSMLDRQVSATSGHSLTLNSGFSCLVSGWGGCQGWGYFLNNSIYTLDQDGEWYYDAATRQVYLFSAGGVPSGIEGSVVLSEEANPADGGLMLSAGQPTAYVTVENLEIKNWFNHGVSAPGAMKGDIWHHITLRGLTVRDVNEVGVNLGSWIWEPADGEDGFRGGYGLLLSDNLIEGANSFGLTGYFRDSTFTGNTIREVGMLEHLGASGMGCGYTAGECTENGDGFRILTDKPAHSGYGNTLRANHIEKTAYNAVDVFGHDNTLQGNYITLACYVKADCGAVRTFGRDNLSTTPVYNLRLLDNLIVDIPGNVDGAYASLPAFGMGLYIDHYSRDVETRGNTIINTTAAGLLYQESTGQAVDNTIFNASSGTGYSAQLSLSGDATRVSLSGNTLFGLKSNAWTLYAENLANVSASDDNRFFHPYQREHITYAGYWPPHSLAEWQSASGKDLHSSTLWYSQAAGEESLARAFINPGRTTLAIDLGSRQYLDMEQHSVAGSLSLAPYTASILVDSGPAPLSLAAISPSLGAAGASDFTLTVRGTGFTAASQVYWNGSPRATTWVDSATLHAAILATDISALGTYPVTVVDPTLGQAGPRWFLVVEQVWDAFVPMVRR